MCNIATTLSLYEVMTKNGVGKNIVGHSKSYQHFTEVKVNVNDLYNCAVLLVTT